MIHIICYIILYIKGFRDEDGFITQSMSPRCDFSLRKYVEFLQDEYKVPVIRVHFRYMKYSIYRWLNALSCPFSTPIGQLMANEQDKTDLLAQLFKALIDSSEANHTLPCLFMACIENLNAGPASKLPKDLRISIYFKRRCFGHALLKDNPTSSFKSGKKLKAIFKHHQLPAVGAIVQSRKTNKAMNHLTWPS